MRQLLMACISVAIMSKLNRIVQNKGKSVIHPHVLLITWAWKKKEEEVGVLAGGLKGYLKNKIDWS